MITARKLVNYTNFADEWLRVGRGYGLADIMVGRYGAGRQDSWVGICSETNEIVRFGQPTFSLQVRIEQLDQTVGVAGKRPVHRERTRIDS